MLNCYQNSQKGGRYDRRLHYWDLGLGRAGVFGMAVCWTSKALASVVSPLVDELKQFIDKDGRTWPSFFLYWLRFPT